MKIIDIRKTQSQGWVMDGKLHPIVPLPVSKKISEVKDSQSLLLMLVEFALTDERHITIYDPRTPEEKAWDTLTLEWKETYQSLL